MCAIALLYAIFGTRFAEPGLTQRAASSGGNSRSYVVESTAPPHSRHQRSSYPSSPGSQGIRRKRPRRQPVRPNRERAWVTAVRRSRPSRRQDRMIKATRRVPQRRDHILRPKDGKLLEDLLARKPGREKIRDVDNPDPKLRPHRRPLHCSGFTVTRSGNPHSKVAGEISHIALSQASPSYPSGDRTPASSQRSSNALDVRRLPVRMMDNPTQVRAARAPCSACPAPVQPTKMPSERSSVCTRGRPEVPRLPSWILSMRSGAHR